MADMTTTPGPNSRHVLSKPAKKPTEMTPEEIRAWSEQIAAGLAPTKSKP